MAKKKAGRPTWFKTFLHHKLVIESVPDEAVGQALKAAYHYFETRESPDLDALPLVVYLLLKSSIDEAFADYQATSDKNKENIKKRWGDSGIPVDTSGNHSLPLDTEDRSQKPEDRSQKPEDRSQKPEDRSQKPEDKKKDVCVSATPPQNTHTFSPPSVDDVREYCDKQGYSTIDPERFISYYGSRGWKIGQTAITDWRAAVDTWNRKDTREQHGKSNKSRWQIGTVV